MDWVDEIQEERARGVNRPLTQSQHAAVNTRYPELTMEHCVRCGDLTGRAGKGDDSLYTSDDEGPLCSDCFKIVETRTVKISLLLQERLDEQKVKFEVFLKQRPAEYLEITVEDIEELTDLLKDLQKVLEEGSQ